MHIQIHGLLEHQLRQPLLILELKLFPHPSQPLPVSLPQNPSDTITTNLNGVSFNPVDDPFSAWERDLLQPTRTNSEKTETFTSNSVVFRANNRKTPEHFSLNDSGKNWRHVYKSLVLLDFLVKCGNEKVAKQCRENIFTIETLKDFQHMEENRDQGLNIRQKAKQITTLLADDERLNTERQKFLQTRNKFKQGSSYSTTEWNQAADNPSELADARPTSAGEEEMQLQIVLALSKEEHEKMDEMRKSDEVRLQLALDESRKESEQLAKTRNQTVTGEKLTQSALDDLLSLGLGQMTVESHPASNWQSTSTQSDLWSIPSENLNSQPIHDPWTAIVSSQPPAPLPLHPPVANVPLFNPVDDPFSAWERDLLQPTRTNSEKTETFTSNSVVFGANSRRTPEHFLGENSNLVNLDNLLGSTSTNTASTSNPFLLSNQPPVPTNPFASQQRKSPTLNEMIAAQQQNRQM